MEGIGDAIGSIFGGIGDAIATAIFDTFLNWIYGIIYDAIADFFTMMGQLGAQIFDLPWIQAFIRLFSLFAWALFAAGTVVAVFDVAIEYQSGRANIKSCVLNILKGFFAASLFSVVPVQLYRFCITLQNTFSNDLTVSMLGSSIDNLSDLSVDLRQNNLSVKTGVRSGPSAYRCIISSLAEDAILPESCLPLSVYPGFCRYYIFAHFYYDFPRFQHFCAENDIIEPRRYCPQRPDYAVLGLLQGNHAEGNFRSKGRTAFLQLALPDWHTTKPARSESALNSMVT